MSDKTKRRLERLELSVPDWAARLPYIDYLDIEHYDDGNWDELYHKDQITVLRNKHTGEIRGVYQDIRSDNEIEDAGGNLAFL